jgi:hypothetical protein
VKVSGYRVRRCTSSVSVVEFQSRCFEPSGQSSPFAAMRKAMGLLVFVWLARSNAVLVLALLLAWLSLRQAIQIFEAKTASSRFLNHATKDVI